MNKLLQNETYWRELDNSSTRMSSSMAEDKIQELRHILLDALEEESYETNRLQKAVSERAQTEKEVYKLRCRSAQQTAILRGAKCGHRTLKRRLERQRQKYNVSSQESQIIIHTYSERYIAAKAAKIEAGRRASKYSEECRWHMSMAAKLDTHIARLRSEIARIRSSRKMGSINMPKALEVDSSPFPSIREQRKAAEIAKESCPFGGSSRPMHSGSIRKRGLFPPALNESSSFLVRRLFEMYTSFNQQMRSVMQTSNTTTRPATCR